LRKKYLVAMACLALLLSSCAYLPLGNTRDLLAAPHLNQRQVAIDAAMRETLNLADIIYKYPQTGNFRSPFVFQDITGSGREEAIVFFAYASAPSSIRFKVMGEREDGSWYAIHNSTGSGEGDQIDFIKFANILDPHRKDMVVGWQHSLRGQPQLGVYSYTEIGFQREILHPYLHWDMRDFSGNGLYDIAVISLNVNEITGLGTGHQLSLLSRGFSGSLSVVDSVSLPMDTIIVEQMIHGATPEGYSIFLDLVVSMDGLPAQLATAVIQVDDNTLNPIVGDNDMMLFNNTIRPYRDPPDLSMDIFGSGVVKIPTLWPMISPAGMDSSGIMLTEYLSLENGEFITAYTAVVNHEEGYIVVFPERWENLVTVVRLPESRQWQFLVLESEEDHIGIGIDLLGIQTFLGYDYRDIFAYYVLLAQRGHLRYYAYLPPPRQEPNPLDVTIEEVRAMFRLI